MRIPDDLNILFDRLYQELDQIELQAIEACRLANIKLNRFPNNFALIQLLAFLNTSLFFVVTSRKRLQDRMEYLTTGEMTEREIREVGEDLSMELGRALETRMTVSRICSRLGN